MADQEKSKIEITDQPEYSDFTIADLEIYGNKLSSPKEWYPNLVKASKFHQKVARVYGDQFKQLFFLEDGKGYLGFEFQLPLSPKIAKAYTDAIQSGKGFRIYAPKDRIITLRFHKSYQERIAARDRKETGMSDNPEIKELRVKLSTFDIVNGTAIIRVVF